MRFDSNDRHGTSVDVSGYASVTRSNLSILIDKGKYSEVTLHYGSVKDTIKDHKRLTRALWRDTNPGFSAAMVFLPGMAIVIGVLILAIAKGRI